MSKLQQAIQELMLKQQEVELYSALIEFLPGWANTDKKYEPVADKVTKELQAFCQKKIRIIEGIEPNRPTKVESAQEVQQSTDKKPTPPPQNEEEAALRDPLKFVVKYRGWENKQVYVKDGYNNVVEATVVGASFPNLKLRLMDGTVLPASPLDVKLINEPKQGE